MELKFKKILAVLLSILILTAVSAESSFVGFAGVSVDIQPADSALPEVFALGDIAGQYSLNDSLSFKGNFQFATGDIVSHGLFQETPSTFSIREISANYTMFKEGTIMNFSALLGDQNSFGSDDFVQQLLGVRKFSSSLLTPHITPTTAGINGFSGIGVSFTDDFGPDALGVYAFYDKDDETDNPQLNMDLRYAFQPGDSILDTTFGLTFPVENETPSGDKVFVLIRQVIFRAGLSSLFSISDRMQLFFQTGISDINIPELNAIKLDDLYLFVEPRVSLPKCDLNISFFCLSDSTLKHLPVISMPLGCNLNVQTLPFTLFSHTASAGIDIAACSSRNIDAAGSENLDVIIAPHIDYSLFTGKFNAALSLHPLDYADVSKLLKISFSYKAQF